MVPFIPPLSIPSILSDPFTQPLVCSSWEELIKWIADLNVVLEEKFKNQKHASRLFAEKVSENNLKINHKFYYKENSKFYELATTREIAEDKVPADLIEMLSKSESEIDITGYIEEKLNLKP